MKLLIASTLSVLCLAIAPAYARCVDLAEGNFFTLTRNAPFFEISNTVSEDGTVLANSRMKRDGSLEKATTRFWNGVIPVERKSEASRIKMKISEEAKLADLSKTGKMYKYPVSILINGNKVDQGHFVVKPIKKSRISIGGCSYRVMVVRTSLEREKGSTINEQALLSLDAGFLLGNVAMTSDWKPRSSVLFDSITAY
ncbi:hypothetical protein [Ruegeria atlantica]|uniref:hypothetical protein n=1 Tax=Ruegeria atlantica TaxID=81569 RepID=UPI00147B970E|nr:hypothetical protein [Ruegeria atlantica]